MGQTGLSVQADQFQRESNSIIVRVERSSLFGRDLFNRTTAATKSSPVAICGMKLNSKTAPKG